MPRTRVLTCPIAAAASMSCPMTSPMTSTVSPSGCRNPSYQSPPMDTPWVAGPNDAADAQPGAAGGLQDPVVPVTADGHPLGGRAVPDGQLQVVGLHRRREQAQLEPFGDPLGRGRQPGVVQRQCGPPGG